MVPYLSEDKLLDGIKALKTYISSVNEGTINPKGVKDGQTKTKKKKASLLDDQKSKLFLQIDFKKILPNKTTYVTRIGPLPHPWLLESESEICFIVQDLDPKNFLPDRELDLRLTRDHYKQKLIEAGLDPDFLKQRVNVMPYRELRNEYQLPDAKMRLCNAFDAFLVERKLMNCKYKPLNLQLGSKFWIAKKKTPVPVKFLESNGEQLKDEILNELNKVSLVCTGRGATASVAFGTLKQSEKQLAANLKTILDAIKDKYKYNVSLLRIKSSKSIAIPIYADLGLKKEVSMNEVCPFMIRKNEAIIDDFPMFNHTDVAVHSDGTIRLMKKAGLEKSDQSGDTFLDGLEKKWLKITNPRKRKHQSVINTSKKRGLKRRKTNVSELSDAFSEDE